MAEYTVVTAAALIIGNEILSGRTRDANIQFLGAALDELGIRLLEARIVPDEDDAIAAAVNALRAGHSYVFVTGGIGPTHDDITSRSIARAFSVPLVRSSEALARLQRHYKGKLNELRARMADLPAGAELIDNPISTAPGFRIGNVFVMAGVPRIMQAMFDGVRHGLKGGARVWSRTLTIFLPEGDVAAGLAEVQGRHPTVEIGSYPFIRLDRLGVAVVFRSTDAAANARAADEVRALVERLGGEPPEEDGQPGT